MAEDQHRQQDPTQQYPQPEYPEQTQMDEHPGLEQEMQPEPDYGVETYKGSAKLEGKKAVITGGDSGIGRAVALAFARAVGEFGSVVILSGNIPYRTEVASVHVFSLVENDDAGSAAAVSVVLLAISVLVLALLNVIQRRRTRHAE